MTPASSHSTIASNMRALLTTVKRSQSITEEEGFRIRIEEGRACFVMKDDHPTVDSALEVVNSYISNWELDDALTSKPGEFKLRFVRPEIVDRKPIPGEHKVSAGPVFWEFSTSVPTVTKGRPYPKPPVGVSLKRNDDVLLMLGRYEDLCKERENCRPWHNSV